MAFECSDGGPCDWIIEIIPESRENRIRKWTKVIKTYPSEFAYKVTIAVIKSGRLTSLLC
jgi:hypothetical protein